MSTDVKTLPTSITYDMWPSMSDVVPKLDIAIQKIQEDVQYLPNPNILVTIDCYTFKKSFNLGSLNQPERITIRIDPRLLMRILKRQCFWDEAIKSKHLTIFNKTNINTDAFNELMSNFNALQ